MFPFDDVIMSLVREWQLATDIANILILYDMANQWLLDEKRLYHSNLILRCEVAFYDVWQSQRNGDTLQPF